MISLEIKCPQLSKPEATERRKNLGRNQAQSVGQAWMSFNLYKEYLFGFETLVFANSGISSMHEQLVTPQRERKT